MHSSTAHEISRGSPQASPPFVRVVGKPQNSTWSGVSAGRPVSVIPARDATHILTRHLAPDLIRQARDRTPRT